MHFGEIMIIEQSESRNQFKMVFTGKTSRLYPKWDYLCCCYYSRAETRSILKRLDNNAQTAVLVPCNPGWQANILICQPGDVGHLLRTIGTRRRHPQHTINVRALQEYFNPVAVVAVVAVSTLKLHVSRSNPYVLNILPTMIESYKFSCCKKTEEKKNRWQVVYTLPTYEVYIYTADYTIAVKHQHHPETPPSLL